MFHGIDMETSLPINKLSVSFWFLNFRTQHTHTE